MNVSAPGRRVADLFAVDARAGDFKPYRYANEPVGPWHGLNFRCPCGCDQVGGIAFAGDGPVWSWDGNLDAPTCSPSVGFYGMNSHEQGHHWHGYLVAGNWEGCP